VIGDRNSPDRYIEIRDGNKLPMYEERLLVRLLHHLLGHITVNMNPFWGITDTSLGDLERSARSLVVFYTSCTVGNNQRLGTRRR
jgi:hypothetical protein